MKWREGRRGERRKEKKRKRDNNKEKGKETPHYIRLSDCHPAFS
jgi:hypothetical protein